MKDPFKHRMLLTRLRVESEGTKNRLQAALRDLEHKAQSARRDLEAGKALDAHLIVNASSITEEIARWNLVRDILPLVEDEE